MFLVGVIDPCLEARAVVSGAGRVVRGAKIDDVRVNRRIRQGQEAVRLVCIHEEDLAARHGVGVHIHRVNRIGDQHGVVHAEQIQDVAEVALCAVRDEDFIRIELCPAGGVVFLDSVLEEIVALLRAIAAEGFLYAHLAERLLHGINDSRSQRQCDVADAQADDRGARVLLAVLGNLAVDIGEQVAVRDVLKIQIQHF